jgi:hypothetical protein
MAMDEKSHLPGPCPLVSQGDSVARQRRGIMASIES